MKTLCQGVKATVRKVFVLGLEKWLCFSGVVNHIYILIYECKMVLVVLYYQPEDQSSCTSDYMEIITLQYSKTPSEGCGHA